MRILLLIAVGRACHHRGFDDNGLGFRFCGIGHRVIHRGKIDRYAVKIGGDCHKNIVLPQNLFEFIHRAKFIVNLYVRTAIPVKFRDRATDVTATNHADLFLRFRLGNVMGNNLLAIRRRRTLIFFHLVLED